MTRNATRVALFGTVVFIIIGIGIAAADPSLSPSPPNFSTTIPCNSTTVPSTATGLWNHTVTLTVFYVRCGDHVTVHLSAVMEPGAQCSPKLHAILSPPVPDGYRPRVVGASGYPPTISFVVWLINNLGVFTIDSSSHLLTVQPLSDSGSGRGCWLDLVIGYDATPLSLFPFYSDLL